MTQHPLCWAWIQLTAKAHAHNHFCVSDMTFTSQRQTWPSPNNHHQCESYCRRGKLQQEVQISQYSPLRSLMGISLLIGEVGDTKQGNPSRSICGTCCLLRLKETIFESTLWEEGEIRYLPVTKRGQLPVHKLYTNTSRQRSGGQLWNHGSCAAENCHYCCCNCGLIWQAQDLVSEEFQKRLL